MTKLVNITRTEVSETEDNAFIKHSIELCGKYNFDTQLRFYGFDKEERIIGTEITVTDPDFNDEVLVQHTVLYRENNQIETHECFTTLGIKMIGAILDVIRRPAEVKAAIGEELATAYFDDVATIMQESAAKKAA